MFALVVQARPLHAADPVAADPVTVGIFAASQVVVGEQFTADVTLTGPAGQLADGVGIYLNFDASKLAVQSIDVTSPLNVALVGPVYDNNLGTVDVVRGTLGDRPAVPFEHVAITFVALQAGTSSITFANTFPRETQVTAFGTALALNVTSATIQAVPDVTSPVITLLGANPLVIVRGRSFADPGATAIDGTDGDLTDQILTSGSVNSAVVGNYTLTYQVQDKAGNAATPKTRTVQVVNATVPDVTAPVLNLLGANPFILEALSVYIDPGATASDNKDGNLTASIVVGGATVKTGLVGDYQVTYNVKDAAGNAAAQQVRVVRVMDTTAPSLTLIGANPLVIVRGSAFADPGATASDSVDGNLSNQIVVRGIINTGVVGNYFLVYQVSDKAGNAATMRTREVQVVNVNVPDVTAPMLTLLGANPFLVEALSNYADPGATATDNVDGELDASIVVGGDAVNTQQVGDYLVTYNVQDAAGNAAPQQVRVVRVLDTTAPVITLLGEDPLEVEVDQPFVDPGATANDAVDGDLTGQIEITGANIDTSVVGGSLIRYRVADASGNVVELTRTVEVVPPTGVTGEIKTLLPMIRSSQTRKP